MRKLLIPILLLLLATGLAAAEYVDVDVDCWDSPDSGSCKVCGEAYTCETWDDWTPNCDFEDPLPDGAVITGADATMNCVPCGTADITASINQEAFASGSTTGGCSCGTCEPFTISSGDDLILNSYVYGGTNTLNLVNKESGSFCLGYVTLRLYYGEGQQDQGSDIPEFGIIAAIGVLGAAAQFAYKRRQ